MLYCSLNKVIVAQNCTEIYIKICFRKIKKQNSITFTILLLKLARRPAHGPTRSAAQQGARPAQRWMPTPLRVLGGPVARPSCASRSPWPSKSAQMAHSALPHRPGLAAREPLPAPRPQRGPGLAIHNPAWDSFSPGDLVRSFASDGEPSRSGGENPQAAAGP
jgi:hypothetical protein